MSPKTRSTLRLTLALALVLGVALVPAASADTKMVMKNHTDAYQMMGQSQPAEESDVTFWIGDDRAARSDGDTTLIIRPDQQKVYVVDHTSESYSAIDLPVDIMSLLPEETRKQMEPMMKSMEMTAVVERSGESKEINGWSAQLWDVTLSNSMGMKIVSQVWASNELDVDMDSFRALSKAMASMQPGVGAAAEELLKIDGVPVLMESDVQMMGTSFGSREELISATTEDAPAGTYDVPEGYTEKQYNAMGQGR